MPRSLALAAQRVYAASGGTKNYLTDLLGIAEDTQFAAKAEELLKRTGSTDIVSRHFLQVLCLDAKVHQNEIKPDEALLEIVRLEVELKVFLQSSWFTSRNNSVFQAEYQAFIKEAKQNLTQCMKKQDVSAEKAPVPSREIASLSSTIMQLQQEQGGLQEKIAQLRITAMDLEQQLRQTKTQSKEEKEGFARELKAQQELLKQALDKKAELEKANAQLVLSHKEMKQSKASAPSQQKMIGDIPAAELDKIVMYLRKDVHLATLHESVAEVLLKQQPNNDMARSVADRLKTLYERFSNFYRDRLLAKTTGMPSVSEIEALKEEALRNCGAEAGDSLGICSATSAALISRPFFNGSIHSPIQSVFPASQMRTRDGRIKEFFIEILSRAKGNEAEAREIVDLARRRADFIRSNESRLAAQAAVKNPLQYVVAGMASRLRASPT